VRDGCGGAVVVVGAVVLMLLLLELVLVLLGAGGDVGILFGEDRHEVGSDSEFCIDMSDGTRQRE
jgi:hypothetical protein